MTTSKIQQKILELREAVAEELGIEPGACDIIAWTSTRVEGQTPITSVALHKKMQFQDRMSLDDRKAAAEELIGHEFVPIKTLGGPNGMSVEFDFDREHGWGRRWCLMIEQIPEHSEVEEHDVA
jgi:hypothetical protein